MNIRLFIALFFTLALVRCSSRPGPSLRTKGIAIQPIAYNDPQHLAFVQHELSTFYNCPVYVLKEVDMPGGFLNLSKGERYCADSILHWLSRRKNDSISILLGLTGKDIYTADKDEYGHIKKPLNKYEVWGILGLGYQPGDACVISDARFRTTGNDKYEHRLRTIVIHEVGHNIGLPHCRNLHCIMNDANEHISTVDSSGTGFCLACQKKVFDLE